MRGDVELTNIINKAKSGDAAAQAAVAEWFGDNPNYETLTEQVSSIAKKADGFKSSNFRKFSINDASANGSYRAYANSGTGTIYLSKTAVNDIFSGAIGRYTLVHEIAHLSYRFSNHSHTTYNSYEAIRGGKDNYSNIYAYQGLLRSQ